MKTPIQRSGSHLPTEAPTPRECMFEKYFLDDLNQQLRHANCCRTKAEADLLRLAARKIKIPSDVSSSPYWAKQAARNIYGSTCSLLACSKYVGAEDFIRCGHSTFSCRDRLFCPRCCYNRLAKPILDEFTDAFGADNDVFYIVMSLSMDPDETHRLIFKDIGDSEFHDLKTQNATRTNDNTAYGLSFETSADLRDCRILWNFFAEAIHACTGDKHGCFFSGVVGGPELALRLKPLRVLPHANYIAWSPGFSIDGARKLRRFVRQKMLNCRLLQTKIFPSIACYKIRSTDDFRRIVNYIFKPIDLATAYKNAAEFISHTPIKMSRLNSEVNVFLNNVSNVFWNLRRVSRYGLCCANHSRYFGHITKYRLTQRRRSAGRRACERGERKQSKKSKVHDVERWELHQMDQLDRPPLMRRSKFSYWVANNEHRPPPRPPHSGGPPSLAM